MDDPNNIDQKIGAWLKKNKEAQNLDNLSLTKLSGVANSQISRIENGRSSVTSQALVRLCYGLRIEPNEFMREFGFNELSYDGAATYLDAGKHLRKERRLRQKTLADVQEAIGVPQSTLSRLEKGEVCLIRFSYIVRLNALFECSPSILSMFWRASELYARIELNGNSKWRVF
jgi:transcriptional regulator with XRE-family HTH domain